jgi:AraC-like DNA-binding protein
MNSLFLNIPLILLISSGALFSRPVLTIDNYRKATEFSGKDLVLIKKGDDPSYSKTEYDDRGWEKVSLPASWDKKYPGWTGICWYRLHVRFPEELPDSSMGISLGTISDVDEVYFNGHLIGRTGSFPPERKSSYDRKRIYEIPTKHIKPGAENLFAIRIAGLFSHEAGPYTGSFTIEQFSKLQENILVKEFSDSFFVIIYIVVAIYFGIIFVRKSDDKEYLFFSLLTLTSAVYLFLRTQIKYFLTDDFLLLKRIEYIHLFIILVFMIEFFTYYFRRRHTLLHYIYFAITLISLIPVIIKSDYILWNKVLYYVVEPSWLIPLGYFIYVAVKEYKDDEDAKYVLYAFPVVWIIILNDVLVDRRIYTFPRLSIYSFMVVIIGTAVLMRKRFNRLYSELMDIRKKRNMKTSVTDETREKLDRVIDYLEKNYNSDISREGLAEYVEMNSDYLGKLFREYTGFKISEYINNLRIMQAKELLVNSEEKVIDIAYTTGFENLSTFYRVFQNLIGVSPSKYREKYTR